jgi:hypothetical protein
MYVWWHTGNLESNGEPSSMTQTTSPMSQFDPNRPDPNKYGKQAYACVHDGQFAKFAAQKNPDATLDYIHHVSEFISAECGVEALRSIDGNPEAIEKWQALKAQYDAWLERGA